MINLERNILDEWLVKLRANTHYAVFSSINPLNLVVLWSAPAPYS